MKWQEWRQNGPSAADIDWRAPILRHYFYVLFVSTRICILISVARLLMTRDRAIEFAPFCTAGGRTVSFSILSCIAY